MTNDIQGQYEGVLTDEVNFNNDIIPHMVEKILQIKQGS